MPVAPHKTVLLTGGTGFFGKSILDAHRRGLLRPFGVDRIVAVARNASRLRIDAPELCDPGVELIDADVLRLDSTFGADVVIHAAASSDAQRYQADPSAEARIIVDGTRRVCEVVRDAKLRPRLLHVSSGAVYGRQPPGIAALAEDTPLLSSADPHKEAYAQAKRAAEALVGEFAAGSGISARIARCFAFVGSWLPRDKHFAIGNFIGNALRGEPIEVKARHPVIRSYLHADDLAIWLLRLATADADRCAIFNVGSDEAVSVQHLASMVAEAGGVDVLLPEAAGRGEGGAPVQADRYVPDVCKARRELGLTVTIPLVDAIERTLRALTPAASRGVEGPSYTPVGVRR
ncbi:MAG: NAD(P)-dependent oxidoreductase [Betaproteobacteria bacterium]